MLIQMKSPNGKRLWTAVGEGENWHHAWSEVDKVDKKLQLRAAPEDYVDAMRKTLTGLGWVDHG